MSATALQRAYQKIAQSNANRGGAPTLSPAASLYAKDKDEEEKKKNRGGLLGGLGYVGEKLGLGFLQGIEGVWDYAAGGIASIFNANEWAEQQFSSDWLNYNHADDWYNPGDGWKVAGDVTGGIGTSVPAIVAAGLVTYATGGAALPIVGTALPGIVGIGVGSLSAAGTSTKEAMQESGELTGKEYLYGAGMGAVEAVTEKLSGGLGAGVTKATKSIGKAFGKVAAKETAEAAAKTAAKKGVALSLKTAAKSARREFVSEAFEEGFSEWIAPYIARATYNPNAQNATAEEVFYSALVGGLSGVGTAGGVGAFTQLKNVSSGNEIVNEGRAKQILDLAKRYTEDGFSNTEDAQGIREIYEKLAPAVERGEALSKEQRRMLGELNSFEVAEQLRPTLQRSALTAVQSADAIAERLNADGRYKMVNDKFVYVDSEQSIPEGATVREITAEDIKNGYDPSKKDSIREAIQKNDVLRYIAASDAAGRFIMTAKDFEKAALSGQKIQSQADLNYFIENASAEQKAAVGRELGVTDWNTLNIEGFNERAAAYRESGKAEAYKQKTAKIEKMKQLADSKPKSIPRAIALADGDVKHYADADSNIAIARTGDTFLVYDYNTGNVTRNMTRAEVNAELARYRQSKSATTETTNATSEKTSENFSSDAEIEIKDEKISKTAFENEFSEEKSRPTVKEIKAANEAKEQAKRFDALAKEKIKDYDGLSEANKSMIRKIFREAEANGISEADALSYARVSARTGLDITFDKKACYKGKNEAGADVYHAGFYDPENNRIVVNPETKKKHTVLLIHELSHAMRSYRKNGEVKYFIDKDAKVSEKMWKEIRKYYADENGKVDEALTLDEASAYYAEAIFGTEGAIDLLLGEKPTLKQKILSFFTKSAAYYSTDEKLSKEARRHFRKFKAMFDAFTARNYGRNAETGLAGDKKDGRRYSFSSIAFSFHGVDNMTAAEFESKDYKKTEGYKAYVEECLNNMRQTQKGFDEKAARKQIEKSIDGIVSVSVAMKKAGYDIADTAEQRSAKDTKNRLLFSSLEPNSDYFTSSDISTICDKRKNFAEIYDDIVRAEEAKGVPKGKRFFDNVDNYFYIHKVLADKGLTQPCRQCYVESMRKNLAPMANAFLTLVQEADGNNTKNPQLYNQSGKDKGKIKANNAGTREAVRKILDGYGFSPESLTAEMLTTEDGLAEMKITMPELYERFNSFYGQSKPKMPKGATPFRFGELTALLTDNHGKIKESLVKKINSTGGFRLQSYSDFQIQNYADVLQVIFEAGTLGLHGHAYTKVPAFIDATANTNLKRNMSIFMYNDNGQWKIDRNDSFPYTLEQIYDLEKADESGNTGIIAVVQNEDMASWVMANDKVGYFIPFHKSGIKMGVVRETIVKEDGREIKGYKDIKDHTRQQTEVWAKTSGDKKANTKVDNPINIYDFWDFDNTDNLSQKELIEKNIERYIDECEKHGYLPKFREYVMGNDKVLGNVLKYAKELGMVSESATVSDISFKYKGYTIPYGYYKCLGDFSMFKPDGTASPIQPLSLENYDFAKAVKLFSDAESVRRNEILQQFANGTEREYYRNSTMTAEELQKVIDTKRTEVVNEIVGKSARRASMDSDYMSAVESGDMVTAQRMVDEAYSYESLTKKSDLSVVTFPTELPMTENGKVDTNAVVARGRLNARKQKNPNNTETSTYVRVDDIGLDVLLSKNGMTHGIARSQETAFAVMKIGDVLKNSVAVNELNGSATRKTEMSYVLLGACRDSENLYVVRSVVSKLENDVTEIDVYQLSAVKSKKTETPTSALGGTAVTEQSSLISSESPVVSIADFLEYVKTIPLSNEVFSEDVAKKLGVERSEGTLTPSLRYSMEEIDPAKMGEPTLPRTAGTMSVGQYKKRIADLTKAKSYSKDQIYDIVKKLPMADMAMEKTREQVAEAVWQIYNEQLTASERREAAHDIAQFLTARLMSEAKTENPDAAEANEAMAYLRTGIGRLAFSEANRSEILHNLDKDGWRRILGRWGFKGKKNADVTLQGVRTPMEVFVTDVAREMPGMEHLEQMHPVEAFLEIDSYYSRVKEEAAKKKTSAFLYMSDEDINSLAKSIEDIIVEAYNQGGGKSIFIKRIEQGISYYEQRAAKYKEEFNEIRGRDKIHGLLMDQTQKLKDLKLRRFANITDGANETFKNIISELARLQYRGNLSVTNAKKAVKDLYVWYTSKEVKENLFGFTPEDPGLWQQGVAEMLEELSADENKNFSKVELYALLDVLTYFTHFVQNFGKVWHHGEWVDAKELATNFIQVAQNQSKVKHHLVRDLLRKYLNTFGDPAAVVRMMDQYQDGFFTQIYDDLRDAAISASYAERDILSAYDDFLKNNKRYVENASKETVSYRGVDVPKMHLIGLYMTMKRKHAQAGYAINGFSFKDAKGDTVRVRGSLDPDAVYTKQEIEDYIARERKKIENLLSDTDKQYISILEKVYNEDAKRLKADRDIQRFGMTNATNDYYYPIRRANAAQKLDADMQMEIDRVSSASFNKDTVAGAKQELFIESADSLFLRHVHVVCQYAYLTPVLDMQKMLYNLDISGNKNHPVSIHTETQNIWPEGFKYFREMVSDVQGIPRSSSIGTKFLSSLRSNYAKFQLGANPKTWLTQFSSLFASTSILDASSVIKGFGMPSIGFEQYSKLAKIRVEDNAAAKAQGVLDNKVKRTADTIGDTLMAPIGMMDKFVVGRLFCACQVQIEKNGGAKIGMEENRIEAGKLLTRVILETQQNSLATEKSAAMRSGNEFYRALTMFRSDSMKVIGRVIDGFGEVSALKGILKNKEMDADSRKELEARLKRAKKKTAKASASLILSAVYMAMIAQGFRWLYAKDKDEDETFVGTLTRDTIANMLGGLPGFADAYSKIVEGYDVGNYSYSAINDVLDSAKGLFDIAEGIMTGEGTPQERMRGIRNASYSLGQLLGLPTRNAYNLLYGLTKRISPRAGYKIDSAFYEKNFKTDLEKALEKGDDRMATLAMQLLLGERIGEDVNEAVFNELFELSKQGYKVLPRVTPDSISINGNVYEFTEDERSEVGRIYEEREQGLKKLFASSAYKSLSGEEKEKAVSTVYDLYYDKALSEALGVDRGNKLLFASAMGFDKYSVFKLKTSAIEPDTDRRGEKIEGSKRKNTIAAINKMNATREEKLLMIVASGYALKDGDIRGLTAANAKRLLLKYILSMKGTQEEKAALAEACGFEVKNGKILKNSL